MTTSIYSVIAPGLSLAFVGLRALEITVEGIAGTWQQPGVAFVVFVVFVAFVTKTKQNVDVDRRRRLLRRERQNTQEAFRLAVTSKIIFLLSFPGICYIILNYYEDP